MIPDFEKEIRDAQGTRYLPPGVYEATWEEFFNGLIEVLEEAYC